MNCMAVHRDASRYEGHEVVGKGLSRDNGHVTTTIRCQKKE